MALPTKTVQDERLVMITKCFMNELTQFHKEYEEMIKGYNLLMGDHYTPAQVAYYKSLKRPTNVWNLFMPVFNHVVGEFIATKSRLRIYGYNGGNATVAKMVEQVCQNIMLNSDYKTEMIGTYVEGMIKRGWSTLEFTDRQELEGSILVSNVRNFEVMFDSSGIRADGMDQRYQIRSRWMDTSEILSVWPQHRNELKGMLLDKNISRFESNAQEDNTSSWQDVEYVDQRNGKYRVIEFQWKDIRDADVLYDPVTNDMEALPLDDVKRKLIRRANPNWQIIGKKDVPITMTTYVIPAASFFLDEYENPVQDNQFNYFSFSAYSAYAPNALNNFGLTKNGQGPQMDFNESMNRKLDVMNKASNAGVMMKPDAIKNFNAIHNRTSQPGIEILVKSGHRFDDVYKPMETQKFPFSEKNAADDSFNLFHKILSITENLRGETQTAQENASLYAQRLQQAQKALLPINSAFQSMETRLWNRGIKMIQRFYTTERVIPMMGRKEAEFITINKPVGDAILNNVTLGKYMIFPSTETTNPTIQQAKFMMKRELVMSLSELFGPQLAGIAIDFDWYLEDVDLGDLTGLISRLKQIQTMLAGGVAQQNAQAEMGGLFQLIQQRLGLGAGGQQPLPAGQPNA